MKFDDYFENAIGVGVLSTADDTGKVNAAIYGRPHFMDEHTVAQSQGVVCEFIRSMVITFHQQWVHYGVSESCESNA